MAAALFVYFLLAASSASAAFDLSRYPVATEIVLGSVVAEVQPVQSVKVKAQLGGSLLLHLPPAGQPLPKGALWGEFDPARLALERDACRLAGELLREKETPNLRYDQVRTRAELTERLEEIERQSALLDRMQREPELAELYLKDAGRTVDDTRLRDAAALLRHQAELLRGVLAYAGTARQEELETRALTLKLRQQELELTRREAESRLTMPFAGEVILIPPAPADGGPLRIEAGRDLAWLQDCSRLTARIPLRRPEWRLADPARLNLRLGTGGVSAPLAAAYTRRLVEEFMGREELVCHFTLAEADAAAARALVGGQVPGQLVYTLPAAARLVPKLELVLADPALFRDAGWAAGLGRLVPGARVLAIGETHLAVLAP